MDHVDSLSLAQETAPGQRTVHVLVSRTVRKRFDEPSTLTYRLAAALANQVRGAWDANSQINVANEIAHARALRSDPRFVGPAHAVLAQSVGGHDYWMGRYREG